jgi:hypothetical protein
MKKQLIIFIVLLLSFQLQVPMLLAREISSGKQQSTNKYQQALEKAKAGNSSALPLLKEGVVENKLDDNDVYLALSNSIDKKEISAEILCFILTKHNKNFNLKYDVGLELFRNYSEYAFVKETFLEALSNTFQISYDLEDAGMYHTIRSCRVSYLQYLHQLNAGGAVSILLDALNDYADGYQNYLSSGNNVFFQAYMKYPGYDETWDYLSKFADENAIPILEKNLNYSFNSDKKNEIDNAIMVIEGERTYVDKYEIKRKKEAELIEKASKLQLPLDIPPIRKTVIIDGKKMSLDEAFPILEERIYSGDKKTLISTIDKLSEYGNMLKDRPIITKLIDIYYKESDQDLRISIIVALSVCGDQRAAAFFDKLNESDDANTQDILNAVKILLLKSY